jgi:phage terminase large subunit GpA-like protein
MADRRSEHHVDDALEGEARRSNIASFWLQGPAAAFQSWQGLVLEWLQAQDEFERTGNTEPLKTTVQQSQGKPYRPPLPDGGRLPEELQARAEDLERGVVPIGARFLITAVDVQKKRFVVQVIGYGRELERWVVDRFEITKSKRADGERRVSSRSIPAAIRKIGTPARRDNGALSRSPATRREA